ncbi:MAG: hypothetical protein JXR94_20255 [Candidatus Hydrogenedentes bacterium]|nr:hypothetical protein [Candidatus Hydrogenedentota bacterium]
MSTTKLVTMAACTLIALAGLAGSAPAADEPIALGARLEPLVDDFLIDTMAGVALTLHNPIPRELSIVFDAPWEGNTCCYVTVFQDDDRYRMYYRGSNFDLVTKEHAGQRVCYAESVDGIHWTKPELGLFEFEGSKANNIVWDGIGVHNFAPFKDPNPDCPPEARYKAVASGPDKSRLVPFQSADAIHWELIQEAPIITEGAFDSQNLAFWDSARGQYVEFHRGFNEGVRDIMTSTSDDFMHWTEPRYIDYGDAPREHLYTNAVTAYFRAPHIFMGFPKRFVPSRDLGVHPHPGVSDGVFMTSRDGVHWHRWREALIRPGLQQSRWVNRNNMTSWGILRTTSEIPGLPDELSIYSTEGYYVGPCGLRRFTSRLDGFVSINAPGVGGEFVTKPLTFAGVPGAQGAEGPAAIAIEATNPIAGAQSLAFAKATVLQLPGTQHLGPQATLAVRVRSVPAGLRRLFSAYNGGGLDTTQGELWFDIDSDGTIGEDAGAIRFAYDGAMVTVPSEAVGDWSGDAEPHHIAATYDDGVVCVYFDGNEVARGGAAGKGDLEFIHGDLLFGEDYAPTLRTNEPFLGVADDLLVLRRALTPDEVARLAAGDLAAAGESAGALYTMENDAPPLMKDTLTADGAQDVVLPTPPGAAETELVLNYSTSAAGSIRCEILDADGAPIPGYALEDCEEIYGDHIERAVAWRGNAELNQLTGTPIRLRFVMADADLYAIQFR